MDFIVFGGVIVIGGGHFLPGQNYDPPTFIVARPPQWGALLRESGKNSTMYIILEKEVHSMQKVVPDGGGGEIRLRRWGAYAKSHYFSSENPAF